MQISYISLSLPHLSHPSSLSLSYPIDNRHPLIRRIESLRQPIRPVPHALDVDCDTCLIGGGGEGEGVPFEEGEGGAVDHHVLS